MNSIFQNFASDTKRVWPFGLRLGQITQELSTIKCPTHFKLKLNILKKQDRLEKVLELGIGFYQQSLLEKLIKSKKFEEALTLVEYGALNKFQNKAEVLELLKRKTRGVGLNSGRACPKLRAQISKLATAIFKETEPELVNEVFAELLDTKHPIASPLKKLIKTNSLQGETSIQTADNSPDEIQEEARLKRLIALGQVFV